MLIFNVSHKMANIYKFRYDKEIPDQNSNSFPLWNWYVKPHVVNRKRYVLFLERNHYLCVWAFGITAKNLTEVFKQRLEQVLHDAGIPSEKIVKLGIEKQESYKQNFR